MNGLFWSTVERVVLNELITLWKSLSINDTEWFSLDTVSYEFPHTECSYWWYKARLTCFPNQPHSQSLIETRYDINLDMLIWLSESSLWGWFSEISLIRDNQGRETVWLSKGLIIKPWKVWLSLIIKVFTTSLPSFPILPTIRRTKHLTE
jgi:hypothetical protein